MLWKKKNFRDKISRYTGGKRSIYFNMEHAGAKSFIEAFHKMK